MASYLLSFTVQVDDDTDPSSILDAGIEAIGDLEGHLEAVNVFATFDDDEVCVTKA